MTQTEVGKKERPKEVAHDESPSIVNDHAFEPRAEWWTRCKHCLLYEAAHAETTLVHPPGRTIEYMGDDEDD